MKIQSEGDLVAELARQTEDGAGDKRVDLNIAQASHVIKKLCEITAEQPAPVVNALGVTIEVRSSGQANRRRPARRRTSMRCSRPAGDRVLASSPRSEIAGISTGERPGDE